MEGTNITPHIQHPLVYTPSELPPETFEQFKARKPFVYRMVDNPNSCIGFSTHETWRKIITCMVVLCYYVRECGYILTPRTFEHGNMVIKNGEDIKFRILYGVPVEGNDGPRDRDFIAISILLQVLVSTHDLEDVNQFIQQLRRRGNMAPSKPNNQILIRCNYALMSNDMRREFLVQLFVDYNYASERGKRSFDHLTRTLMPAIGWQSEAQRRQDSPLDKIYHHMENDPYTYTTTSQYNDAPSSCMKFIRNSLTHLTDRKYNYHPSRAYLVVDAYFGRFMGRLQNIVFDDLRLVAIDSLLRYKPST